MDIIVAAQAINPQIGTLSWTSSSGPRMVKCALGYSGLSANKREGDGATPVGRFALRRVLYRADHVTLPPLGLPVAAIDPSDGWCDDPASPDYNRPIKLPSDARHEKLWRKDALYDIVVVIGHNDDPPVPGAGSAIFLHVASDDYRPTEGCVAIAHSDLIALLADCRADTMIAITM